jgi:hypothetical protein
MKYRKKPIVIEAEQCLPMKFPVFDATCNTGKPGVAPSVWITSTLPGMLPIYVGGFGTVEEKRTRDFAKDAREKKWLLCLDIETLDTDIRKDVSDRTVELSIRSMMQMLRWVREEAPGLRCGFYGIMPIRAWFTAANCDPSTDQYRYWQEANTRLTFSRRDDGNIDPNGLVDQVDVVFPSLATFSADPRDWLAYATANIAEARKYGKAVYPFLRPSYHESVLSLAGKRMPVAAWVAQLNLCRALADGVVIWDGTAPYDATEPWRVATDQWLTKLAEGK